MISDRSRLACGREGTVKQIVDGRVTLETSTLQVLQAPLADVRRTSSFGAFVQPKKLTQLSNIQRVQWLMQVGFDDPREGADTFVSLHHTLKGEHPILLGVDHLKLFTCWLRWALPLEDLTRPVVLLEGDVLRAWYGALIDAKHEPAHLEALQKCWTRPSAVQQALTMFPIWSDEHWTLLVVDSKQKECRYYDSLQNQQNSSWMFADHILAELKKVEGMQWLPEACPARTNYCRQGPLECGLYVCWWMEEEVRRALGERPFWRGMPRILGKGGMRSQVCSIFENLLQVNKNVGGYEVPG